MAHKKVYGFCESGCKVDITPTDTVETDGKTPVTGEAVRKYALAKDSLILTTVDPGEGTASGHPDGTVILVYE